MSKKVNKEAREEIREDKVGAPPEPKVKTKAAPKKDERGTRRNIGKFTVVTY